MRWVRRILLAFCLVFLAPLGLHAAWWLSNDPALAWNQADWSSTGLLPAAGAQPEASVHVFAARVGRWRGVFAHHSWIVIKEQGPARYTRYDVVGWGNPVRIDVRPPDGRWYGNLPLQVAAIEGAEAERLIPRIRAAVASYPHARYGDYFAWPGPNSNSFVNYVLSQIPEAGIALPPTALGKDYRGTDGWFAGLSPSRTGVQLSAKGIAGVTLAWAEGIEINMLGLVAGVDLRNPALKLPGFGRIGW